MAGADYLRNRGIGDQYTRDWGRSETLLITNGAFATNGLPNFIISPNVRPSNMSTGGLIVSGPLRGVAFGPGGQPFNFQFGQQFGTLMIGGTGEGESLAKGSNLGAPIEAISSLFRAEFELTESLTGFVEYSGAWSQVRGNTQQPRDAGNLVIQRDNPFIPASVRDAMLAQNLQTITVGRLSNDVGFMPLNSQTLTHRFAAGLKGEFNADWAWSGYYQYGDSRYSQRIQRNRIQANWFRAVDAVLHPTTGAVVCRSSLTDPTNGCVPANIFGAGSISQESQNYFMGRHHQFLLHTTQEVASAEVSGELFELPAGPVSVVFGAEYRREGADGDADAISKQVQPNGSVGGYILGNQAPIDAAYHTYEGFGETAVPLARDTSWAKALDFNAAIRLTDYSTSGKVTTWKLGLSYEPVEDLRFRLTRSRDIRAPNLAELYQSGGSQFSNIFNPRTGQTTQVRNSLQGNPDLVPEIATTWTGGVVYQPSFVPGLRASVDYFDIDLKGVIASLPATLIAERCFAGDADACRFIVFDSANNIAFMIQQPANLNSLKTSGIDIEIDYRMSADRIHPALPGDLALRTLATYTRNLTTIDPVAAIDQAGGAVPHWKVIADLNYQLGGFSTNLQMQYVDSVVYNVLRREGAGAVNTINDNHLPARAYFNLSANYELYNAGRRKVQLFGLISNLFDTDPPFAPPGGAGGTAATSTNSTLYDVIGRNYKIGVRFAY